jgi:hypothetical protein
MGARILKYEGDYTTKEFFYAMPNGKYKFYTTDPAALMPNFLEWVGKYEISIQTKINKNSVSSFTIYNRTKKIDIHNMTQLLGDNIDNIAAKLKLDYFFIPY